MYSGFCAFAVVFVVTVVPETKGKSLDDISKLFVHTSPVLTQPNKLNAIENSTIDIKCVHCGMSQTITYGKNEIDAPAANATKL